MSCDSGFTPEKPLPGLTGGDLSMCLSALCFCLDIARFSSLLSALNLYVLMFLKPLARVLCPCFSGLSPCFSTRRSLEKARGSPTFPLGGGVLERILLCIQLCLPNRKPRRLLISKMLMQCGNNVCLCSAVFSVWSLLGLRRKSADFERRAFWIPDLWSQENGSCCCRSVGPPKPPSGNRCAEIKFRISSARGGCGGKTEQTDEKPKQRTWDLRQFCRCVTFQYFPLYPLSFLSCLGQLQKCCCVLRGLSLVCPLGAPFNGEEGTLTVSPGPSGLKSPGGGIFGDENSPNCDGHGSDWGVRGGGVSIDLVPSPLPAFRVKTGSPSPLSNNIWERGEDPPCPPWSSDSEGETRLEGSRT